MLASDIITAVLGSTDIWKMSSSSLQRYMSELQKVDSVSLSSFSSFLFSFSIYFLFFYFQNLGLGLESPSHISHSDRDGHKSRGASKDVESSGRDDIIPHVISMIIQGRLEIARTDHQVVVYKVDSLVQSSLLSSLIQPYTRFFSLTHTKVFKL